MLGIRWRPASAPGGAKNVLLSVSSNGKAQHWHTTSAKLLHTIIEPENEIYASDFKPDGTKFVTAGKDSYVRKI